MAKIAGVTNLQIQPKYDSREVWKGLAEKEGCSFEVLELSSPPALNTPERFRECLEWYRESALATSVHGVFIDINPGSGDAAIRDLSRERCRQSCSLASQLGAKNVVFHSSCFPFLRGDYLDFWAGECAGFYEALAEEWDLNIFIENSPDIDAYPLKELMRRIPDRRVGVCLDIGHVNYSGMCLEEWFGHLQNRIGYLHLSDNEGRYDTHLPLGQGSVDWKKADSLLLQLGRPVCVTLETGTVEETAASLAFLRDRMEFFLS